MVHAVALLCLFLGLYGTCIIAHLLGLGHSVLGSARFEGYLGLGNRLRD